MKGKIAIENILEFVIQSVAKFTFKLGRQEGERVKSFHDVDGRRSMCVRGKNIWKVYGHFLLHRIFLKS